MVFAPSSLAALPVATAKSEKAFGADGLAFHRFPPHAEARAAIVDLAAGGGKTMVAALGNEMANSRRAYFGTARFNADGSLDHSFGRDGFAELIRPRLGGAVGLIHGQAEAVTVDRQGRIVLAGFRFHDATSQVRYPVLVRLLPDGTPDPSFGRDGVATPMHVPEYGEWFSDVAIEAGGRIVAVGGRTQLHEEDGYHGPKPATLARAFLPNGRIDRGFADRGSLSTPVSSDSYFRDFTAFRTVRVLRGGKLLLSGYRNYRLLLERLTPNGHLDRSFGRGGSVQVGFKGSECFYLCEYDSALMLTRDNRILVQGVLNPLASEREALVRFLPAGRVDRSFGNRGFAYDRFGENLVDMAPSFRHPTTASWSLAPGTVGRAFGLRCWLFASPRMAASIPASANTECFPSGHRKGTVVARQRWPDRTAAWSPRAERGSWTISLGPTRGCRS